MYEWVWVKDIKNQYIFQQSFGNSTHQISFHKSLNSNAWVRKRKIIKLLGDGDITLKYSVFGNSRFSPLYTNENKINIKYVRKMFGSVVYDKILSLS
jgi:hypothetical protein